MMMLSAGVWALADAVELHAPRSTASGSISQIQYFGVVSAAPFFHVAIALAGGRESLRPLLVAVWTVPLVSLLMAWTSAWHGCCGPPSVRMQQLAVCRLQIYGWWFWVLMAQHYLLMVGATIALLGAWPGHVGRACRTTMVLVLLAVLLPWFGNVAYIFKLGPWPGLNWLTLSLGVSGWLLVWAVLRDGLLDLLPQAREVLIEMMGDGVLVLDERRHHLRQSRRPADAAPDRAGRDRRRHRRHLDEARAGRLARRSPGRSRRRQTVAGPEHRAGVQSLGQAGRPPIIVARDVTAQKNLEDEREGLIDDLQEALRKVTTLEGMLPICARCCATCATMGYWSRIEEFISSRTPLEFTPPTPSPDCMGRFSPRRQGQRDAPQIEVDADEHCA